ncbi:MAG: zf-HC2 domain-containing protein [Myxococcales bacterium]|nr:zf-HC2 domain-containing protein [Myxococcales bacterium]
MRCREVEKQLSAHLDGELDAAASERITAHLEHCEGCKARALAYSTLDGALDALPRHEPSEAFDDGFRAKLQAARQAQAQASLDAPRSRRRGFFSWPLLAGLGGAAAAVALAVLLIGRSPRDTTLPPRRTLAAVQPSDLALAQHLELLQNYRVVKNLDELENYDVIDKLDRLLGDDK